MVCLVGFAEERSAKMDLGELEMAVGLAYSQYRVLGGEVDQA